MADSSYPAYASVLLDATLDRPFDYGIPPNMIPHVAPGSHVEVPVRNHLRRGYVCSIHEQTHLPRVKSIARLISETPLLPSDLFSLALWMANYYCTPLGKVVQIMLPSSIRKEGKHKKQLFVRRATTRQQAIDWLHKHRSRSPAQAHALDVLLPVEKGMLLTELLEKASCTRTTIEALSKKRLVTLETVRIDRSPLENAEYLPSKPKILTEEQQRCLHAITTSLEKGAFHTHLIHGVTGSGKTEIYLQAIEAARSRNKTVLVLVPEIALTIQIIETFQRRFSDGIAILHHRLSTGERFDEWQRIRRGEASIVIGARSAVFAPLPDLGLVIVDEEHESSYKQNEETPCYHARDVAVMRGKMAQATVVLGSATPSLESYTNAQQGKYQLSTLAQRVEKARLPKVHIVDMCKEYEKASGFTYFSQPLLDGIASRLQKGEKTLLFLNRRGYHTTLLCSSCGQAVQCAHCAVALTYHKKVHQLSCHLCGYTLAPPPRSCPSCHSDATLLFRGAGTEQMERALHAIFPTIRTLRIDADTTRHKGSHQRLLKDFATGKAEVLIGTQMIAKGVHFPEVTLAAIVNSDMALHLPDFRSSEMVFQLLTQVAGRAGRGFLSGEVIIQTNLPTHPTVLLGAEQNYPAFYEQEVANRQLFGFPPFSQMVKLVFTGKNEQKTHNEAHAVRNLFISTLPSSYQVLPNIPCGYAKIKDLFRFQFLLLAPSLTALPEAIAHVRQAKMPRHGCKMLVDVNPSSTYF